MSLVSSGTISLSDVLAEIQRVTPGRSASISLGDSDVLNLAGKSGLPISLSDLYGKSSYIPMTLTGKSSLSTNNSSFYSGGTATTTPSVTVAGGTAPFTYKWTITSQTGQPVLTNDTSATCTVSKSFLKGANGGFDAYLQCVVTDATGRTATTSNVEAYATWGVPA